MHLFGKLLVKYQQSLVTVSGFILDFLAIFFDIGTGGEDWDWEPGERGAGRGGEWGCVNQESGVAGGEVKVGVGK